MLVAYPSAPRDEESRFGPSLRSPHPSPHARHKHTLRPPRIAPRLARTARPWVAIMVAATATAGPAPLPAPTRATPPAGPRARVQPSPAHIIALSSVWSTFGWRKPPWKGLKGTGALGCGSRDEKVSVTSTSVEKAT